MLYHIGSMKSYFKNLFNQLESEDFSYSKHIKRADGFADAMCHAFNGIQSRILYLQREWESAKSSEEDISTYVIDRKDAAGIVIKTSEAKQEDYCHYLMEYVKGSMEQKGYIIQVNKHTAARNSGATQESWHYFFKPKPSFDAYGKYEQRYGNVIVETKKDAKGGIQFKIQCNYYTGFNYKSPISFEDLLADL